MASRNTRILNRHGYYLEVKKNGEISGTKDESSPSSEITIKTVDFGKVTLQGTKTSLYIYMRSNGDLGTTTLSSNENEETIWNEEFADRKGFFQYSSSVNPKWLLGITNEGTKKNGENTKRGQRATEWAKLEI